MNRAPATESRGIARLLQEAVELDRAEERAVLRAALSLADAARTETLKHFRVRDLETNSKSADFDPVTEADRAAERVMRDRLAELRPDDGILGEEFGAVEGSTGLTWVLDPIDGTRGYISGTPVWGTLIALSNANGPIVGIIDQPYIGERFIGASDLSEMQRGAETVPLATRQPRPLADATVLTTFPEVGSKEEGEAFHAVARRARLTRYGMDCYGYALLAAGHVDLVIEAGLNPYDIHAPIAVVQAAGGIVTGWKGEPAHGGGRVVAAANAEIHQEALDVLRSVTG